MRAKRTPPPRNRAPPRFSRSFVATVQRVPGSIASIGTNGASGASGGSRGLASAKSERVPVVHCSRKEPRLPEPLVERILFLPCRLACLEGGGESPLDVHPPRRP